MCSAAQDPIETKAVFGSFVRLEIGIADRDVIPDDDGQRIRNDQFRKLRGLKRRAGRDSHGSSRVGSENESDAWVEVTSEKRQLAIVRRCNKMKSRIRIVRITQRQRAHGLAERKALNVRGRGA